MGNPVWVARDIPNGNTTVLHRMEQRDGHWLTTALVVVGDNINSYTLKRWRSADVPMQMADPLYAAEVAAAQPSDLEVLSDYLREAVATVPSIASAITPAAVAVRPRLHRPDGSDPDGHAKAVAVAYREHVAASRRPGPSIAAEAGVPVATARGWIQEARRRGHLRPGRRGRAGG